MSCKCKMKVEETMKNENDIGPMDSCIICAQKHFLSARGAVKEFGYEKNEKNHNFAIEQLSLAIPHVQQDFPVLAQQIRDIRHYVQYWEYDKIGGLWDDVAHIMNIEIRKQLKLEEIRKRLKLGEKQKLDEKSTETNESNEKEIRNVYIFSNVEYSKESKINVSDDDVLVFLNKATTIDYYKDKKIKMIYHRYDKPEYGEKVPAVMNRYVFNDDQYGIPSDFMNDLKEHYDWNYDVKDGQVKDMSTGYIVAKHMEQKFAGNKIILVNFDYNENILDQSFVCNYEFESKELREFQHVST